MVSANPHVPTNCKFNEFPRKGEVYATVYVPYMKPLVFSTILPDAMVKKDNRGSARPVAGRPPSAPVL